MIIEIGDVVVINGINILHGCLAVCTAFEYEDINRYKMLGGSLKGEQFWLHDKNVVKVDGIKKLREFLK